MNKRIIVKIGSQVLCDLDGALNREVLSHLVEQLASLRADGWQVLLVSSGAVAAGSGLAGERLQKISDPVARKQVMAATGQVCLMQTYRELFEKQGLTIAQVLATKSDFQSRRHYLNMRGCIEALLTAGIIPVVNENDVVSVTELMFTDNDELAGLLAAMLDAKGLFLLSDIDGIYLPGSDNSVIQQWRDRHARPILSAATAGSNLGRGGIHTKLRVARRVANLGIETWIANARRPNVVADLLQGTGQGTHFAAKRRASPVKRWVAASDGHEKGWVVINHGAVEALCDNRRLTSLLPVGITAIKGEFEKGDVLRIESESGELIALGKAGYGSGAARKSLGQRGGRALVHYDYLYIEQDTSG